VIACAAMRITALPHFRSLSLMLLGLATILFTSSCAKKFDDELYAPVGFQAQVRGGELFALNADETPLADSPTSMSLWMHVRGIKDMDAIKKMVSDGRVIFIPNDSYVDVLEHNNEDGTWTKVRIRGGQYVGREMWTYAMYVKQSNYK
jgi:hypothetical protein